MAYTCTNCGKEYDEPKVTLKAQKKKCPFCRSRKDWDAETGEWIEAVTEDEEGGE